MAPRDIFLFLRSARTDAAIARARAEGGARAAFEAAYGAGGDPWASEDPRYSYQRWKYEGLIALLPPDRHFGRTLDLGCGTGALSRLLAARSGEVLGLDIAQEAVTRAAQRARGLANIRFEQADVTNLQAGLDGLFDLVVVADTLYYLDATDELSLATIASRIARLLAPGGLCLVANHYFFRADPESRLSRRIHEAFAAAPALARHAEHWRPFYLASLYDRIPPTAESA